MLILYRVLFPFFILVYLPFQVRKMLRRGGYREHFGMRFGRGWNLPSPIPGKRRLWIQAVSVGEVNATALLIEHIIREDPAIEIVVTTTTSTGYRVLERLQIPQLIGIGYFPIDWIPFTRMAFRAIRPDRVALFEGEVWPEFLHQARRAAIPSCLINARLSDRSFRRWKRFGFLARRIFARIDRILAASKDDATRFECLLPPSHPRPVVTGNIKCDLPPTPPLPIAERIAIARDLGILTEVSDELPPVLFGVSTWPGEESLLLAAYRELRTSFPHLKLVLCPRHAERRSGILDLLREQPFPYRFRTGYASGNSRPGEPAAVAVLDTTGELARCVAIGTVAVIGKSFPPNEGGQSPLDPIRQGVPTVFGPGMSNFRSIASSLLSREAALRTDGPELTRTLKNLLGSPAAADRLSSRALQWLESNRGAIAATTAAILDAAS